MLCSGTYPSRSNNGVLPLSYPGKNRVCCCFSFLYIVCVPDSTLHSSTRITGVPPPPPRRPRIFTTARARTTIKIVDYEHPSFSQGKAPWGRGCRFPSLRDSRASETRARVKITGTRERWDAARREKHESLGFVCSPSFFLSPRRFSPFSRWMMFTCVRVSLALLSLRENERLLIVYKDWYDPFTRVVPTYREHSFYVEEII